MSAPTKVYREAERARGLQMAGSLSHLLDAVAYDLHHNESLHLHDCDGPVGRCGYCYLRAGRTLGIVAQHLAVPGGAS